MASPVVHIEIPANDPKSAATFYADVFGWNTHSDPNYDYWMFAAEGGPGGGFVKVGQDPTGMSTKPGDVLIYLGTDDIDGSLGKIEAAGGKAVLGKTDIPGIGWFGIFTDPTGNRVALFTPSQE